MHDSSLIVRPISVHVSMYSDSDDICDVTFIDNSFGKSLTPSPSSARSDCDVMQFSSLIVPVKVLILYIPQCTVIVMI